MYCLIGNSLMKQLRTLNIDVQIDHGHMIGDVDAKARIGMPGDYIQLEILVVLILLSAEFYKLCHLCYEIDLIIMDCRFRFIQLVTMLNFLIVFYIIDQLFI